MNYFFVLILSFFILYFFIWKSKILKINRVDGLIIEFFFFFYFYGCVLWYGSIYIILMVGK